MTSQIVPVRVGRAPGIRRADLLWGQHPGETVESPHIIWVVRDDRGDVTVLDTGSPDAEWVTRHHRPFERTAEEEPAVALAAAGVDPAAVRTVVLSHLHYDHCGNNHLFPNAEFVVQRSEVAYAIAPYPVHQAAYEAPALGFTPRWLATMDRTRLIEGDVTLRPGLRLLHIPGHTPGMTALVVDTAAGRYALAGDHCAQFENWRGAGPYRVVPSRTHVNLADYYRSFDRLAEHADVVLPGHDMRVFDQASYPAVDRG
ncbi:N-acyl homoserine lactonase family protein [Micromonospora sp. DT227]|uniref:N-acyl homoserine lactonase family protein n=1 Tax=Micromonospora sp. DT227 TaxID=3393433 RepID=UPI003CEDB6F8